jgi:hypothetical protein
VLSIDFSPRLLAELSGRARGLPVAAVAGNIRDVGALAATGVELVVCMGDTLSHLEREEDLERVFAASRRASPSGAGSSRSVISAGNCTVSSASFPSTAPMS